MLRILTILYISIFGTTLHAKTVEENLSFCIANSQEVIQYAKNFKATFEANGEKIYPTDFAYIVTSVAFEDLLNDTLLSLRVNTDTAEIIKEIEKVSKRISLQRELVAEMVEEAFNEEFEYDKMGEFISACATNFGGETYTMQDEITQLNEKLIKAEEEKRELEEKFKSDLYSKLQDKVAPLEKRVNTLCRRMRTFEHSDVLQEKVFVYGTFYDLCD